MPRSERRRTRPWRVLDSPIHGRGVFAARTIRKGETIIEYRGRRSTWEEAALGQGSIRRCLNYRAIWRNLEIFEGAANELRSAKGTALPSV